MYEHKLYIVDVNTVKPNGRYGKSWIYPRVIATFECCAMPDSFLDLFGAGKKINFDLWVEGCDEAGNECMTETMFDRYGSHCRMIKPRHVIDYLENNTDVNQSDYRRLKPLLGLLKGFDETEWEDLEVVHYGH